MSRQVFTFRVERRITVSFDPDDFKGLDFGDTRAAVAMEVPDADGNDLDYAAEAICRANA